MNALPAPATHIRESSCSSSGCRPLLDRVAVQSSLLAGVSYDPHQHLLELEFRSGTVYQYFRVPRQTYQDLLHADSKGAYFNLHIRSLFRHERLE